MQSNKMNVYGGGGGGNSSSSSSRRCSVELVLEHCSTFDSW